MSKYYKAEDVTELINACEWRMTLAKERHGEGFVDYSKQVLDVDELTKRLLDLPTIEVSEDCISKASVISALSLYRNLLEKEFASNPTVIVDIVLGIADDCIELVEKAPSVVPSRAEGEWIERTDHKLGKCMEYSAECSVCGTLHCHRYQPYKSYCPNCGAKMRLE